MITVNEQGFKMCPQIDGVSALIFDSSRAKECIASAIKNEYKRIMLWSAHCPILNGLDDLLPLKDFIYFIFSFFISFVLISLYL